MGGVWTDFLAHIIAQLAFEKLGKHEDSEREKDIVGGLARSISAGHKGTSASDAFVAVSVAEEYRSLFLLGWSSNGQSLVRQDGHVFDVFKVTDRKSGAAREVWFNIDLFFGKEFGL